MTLSDGSNSAEFRFREAFQRLKENKPIVLAVGTPVNKSNVAREAGYKDPAAFRKERFPTLVWEIKAYQELIENSQPSAYQKKKQRKIEKASADELLDEVKKQRDTAQSQVASLRRAYVEVLKENRRLLEPGDNVLFLSKL